MALMLGALMIQGITPSPQVMTGHPDLFWSVVASMLIGNVILLILNLPMVGLWIHLLKVPYRLLYPAILPFCCICVYSVNSQVFDIFLAAGFGALGFVFKRLDCPPGPLVLGMILGRTLEENMRRALLVSRGNAGIFPTSPISVTILLLAVAFIVVFARRKKIIKAAVEINATEHAENDTSRRRKIKFGSRGFGCSDLRFCRLLVYEASVFVRFVPKPAEGCTEVQGYFFSKPVPASEIAQLLSVFQERVQAAA